MTITFTDEVLENMEDRGIDKADVESVVKTAEETNDKIASDEGTFISRQKIENYTVYSEYKVDGDNAEVIDSYCHRVTLSSDGE